MTDQDERVSLLRQLDDDVNACTACDLHQNRFSSPRTLAGRGSIHPLVAFVGEGPGYEEQRQGVPFVGKAGKMLDEWIRFLDLKTSEYYICNVVKCRPMDPNGNNAPPTDQQSRACTPFLLRQLKNITPQLIVALGRVPDAHLTSLGINHMNVPHPAYFLRRQRLDWRPFLESVKQRLVYVRSSQWFPR